MDAVEIFVRGIWKRIPEEDDAKWVDNVAKMGRSEEPLGDFGPIVKEMIDRGLSPKTIARFAKIIGYETAFGICSHLEDPISSYEGFPEIADSKVSWGLFKLDPATRKPIERMDGAHEILLSMDPTGLEMTPTIGE